MEHKKYLRMYMHTINGKPAFYTGEQICYANKNSLVFPKHLCKSLYELRKQQILSIEWRIKKGFDSSIKKYSYKIIKLETSYNSTYTQASEENLTNK